MACRVCQTGTSVCGSLYRETPCKLGQAETLVWPHTQTDSEVCRECMVCPPNSANCLISKAIFGYAVVLSDMRFLPFLPLRDVGTSVFIQN